MRLVADGRRSAHLRAVSCTFGNRVGSGAAVELEGPGASALLMGCRVTHGAGGGVHAAQGAEAWLVQCDVASCGGSGVVADAGGAVGCARCLIQGNKGSGVAAVGGGMLVAQDCAFGRNEAGATADPVAVGQGMSPSPYLRVLESAGEASVEDPVYRQPRP